MVHRSVRRFLVGTSVSSVLLAAFVSSAAASSAEPPIDRVVTFPRNYVMTGVQLRTVAGRISQPGMCVIEPPALELSPLDRSISFHQATIDYGDCSSTFEIGHRPVLPVSEQGGSSESGGPGSGRAPESIRKPVRRAAPLRVLTNASAYYEIRLLDRIDIVVNRTQAKLWWSYNGSCASYINHDAYWWWQSWTGWWKADQALWRSGGCDSQYSHASGYFGNEAVCHYLVLTVARDVRIRGGYAGGIGGYVAEAGSSASCQPLHVDGDLVRTS